MARRRPSRWGLLALLGGLAGACSSSDLGSEEQLATEDPKSAAFLAADGREARHGVAEYTAEALGVLRVVNESDEATLAGPAHLSSRTVASILRHRAGPDGELGTADDSELVTLAGLDAVDYVGPLAFEGIYAHARAAGLVDRAMTHRPAAERIVAIGDLHGELDATRMALEIVEVVDPDGHWTGGSTVVVQVGDVLDRGDGERQILDWFARLAVEAAEAGGAFVMLDGNHEAMNVAGDLRYVTETGFQAFADVPDLELDDERLDEFPAAERARAAAFLPAGPYARRLGELSVVTIVGDTLFVHAGLLPSHVEHGLERLNFEARAWMLWNELPIPELLDREDGPLWLRDMGEDELLDCDVVDETLAAAGVRRMVIGHSIQEEGIIGVCDGLLWRIDVGMSAYYGGSVEVLEIVGEEIWTVSAQ